MGRLNIAVLAVISTGILIDASALKKRTVPLTNLDGFNTKTLDKKVREEIMFMVLQRANSTVQYQNEIKKNCESSINTTVDECNNCIVKSCGTTSAIPKANIWQTVLPLVLSPALVTGNLIIGIEKTAVTAFKFLGSEGGRFISTLGNVGKNAGGSLLNGAADLINDVGGQLTALGDKMANLASNIGHGLESTVNQIPNLASQVGNGLDQLGSQLSHGALSALSGLGHGATDLVHQIGHGVDTVGHTIQNVANNVIDGVKHIFGKRMDACASGCTSCIKIDTATKTSRDILKSVCGADYAQKQQEIATDVQKMTSLYNEALNHTIIQKVEYDPSSIDTKHGVAFTRVYVTVNVRGVPKRFSSQSLMRLTDIPTWAHDLAEELYEM